MGDNLHTVWHRAELLAIRCRACRAGKIFDKTTLPSIQRGNMTLVAHLKFVCGSCGARDFETLIPYNREQAEAFLAGANPETWGAR